MFDQSSQTHAHGWIRGPIRIAPPPSPISPFRPQALVKWITTPAIVPGSVVAVVRTATFCHFSKLPTELRLKIWALAAPDQRVIELRSWGDGVLNSIRPVKFSVGPHRPPVILQVNQESRREALRMYRSVEIGVSAAVVDRTRRYVPWDQHPANPQHTDPRYDQGSFHQLSDRDTFADPFMPRSVYVDFMRDIIYLGPEFQVEYLELFLTSSGAGYELRDLQYLAIDRKVWTGMTLGHRLWTHPFAFTQQEILRTSLHALHSRPLKEIYIIPDDTPLALEDKYFYAKHDIRFQEPECTYTFRPGRHVQGPTARTAVENLGEWFSRLWADKGLQPPKVKVRSVRRNGLVMGDFKDGIWDIQKNLGDMRVWKDWSPSSS